MVEITDILDVEKYIDAVDAVIFDLDDTLYSEKEYVKSGYKAVADCFGMPELADEMWQVFEDRGKPIDEVFEKHDLIHRKSEALHTYRFHQPDIHLYPGVKEMLDRIYSTKKVGIITDGRPDGQRAKLKALGLDKKIHDIIITDELGGEQYRKPNDIAFRILQNRWGLSFDKIVYVGDNPSKDFFAPKLLKMQMVFFKNPKGLYSFEK